MNKIYTSIIELKFEHKLKVYYFSSSSLVFFILYARYGRIFCGYCFKMNSVIETVAPFMLNC